MDNVIKKYDCLVMKIGTIFISGQRFTVNKGDKSNNYNGRITVTSEQEIEVIENSEQFAKGNIYPVTNNQILSREQEIIQMYESKIEEISRIFNPDEIRRLSQLPDAILEDIRDYAFAQERGITEGDSNILSANINIPEEQKIDKVAIPGIDDITVSELKDLLTSLNIEYSDKLRKPELYELLKKSTQS